MNKFFNKTNLEQLKELKEDNNSNNSNNSNSSFKSSKIRKLLLRITLWELYNEIYLSKHSIYSNYTLDEKLYKSRELLTKIFEGQRLYQTKVEVIFPEPIEYWENLIINIRTFENDVNTPPLLEIKEAKFIKTSKKIKAYTSTDKPLDTIVDCFSDPFTLASELMIQHKLPSDELDYIHGMIQHEMVDLVRSAVESQRENLKKIQLKIAYVEHLTLLSETITKKYHELKNSYENSSKKSLHSKNETKSSNLPGGGLGNSSSNNSYNNNNSNNNIPSTANKTLLHFNKLIIDERRKLDTIEKQIGKILKELKRLEPHEVYNDGTFEHKTDVNEYFNDYSSNQPTISTPPLRRASVSLRNALSTTNTSNRADIDGNMIKQRKPFQSDDSYDSDDFGSLSGHSNIQQKKPFQISTQQNNLASSQSSISSSPSPQSYMSSPMFTSKTPLSTNSIGIGNGNSNNNSNNNSMKLTKNDIERNQLFQKSELDRLQLIEENRRLRNEIAAVTTAMTPTRTTSSNSPSSSALLFSSSELNSLNSSTDVSSNTNLQYIVNELNSWDIERDELDAHIDRLNGQKEELIHKLSLTSSGARYKKEIH